MNTVDRAGQIFDLLEQTGRPLRLTEIARALSVPKSSASNICSTLAHHNLLERRPDDTYWLGVHLLDLGRAYLARLDLPVEFGHVCDDLAADTLGTVVLSVLNGPNVVYIARRQSAAPVGASYVGVTQAAHCTASGKALLSCMSEADVRERLHDPLERFTPHTITSVDALLEDLALARERGYVIDDEENVVGILAFGAPVVDTQNSVIAAVAISEIKAAADERFEHRASAVVRELAAALTAKLGSRAEPNRAPGVPSDLAKEAIMPWPAD